MAEIHEDRRFSPIELTHSLEENQYCRGSEHYHWTGDKPFAGDHTRDERVAADVVIEFCSQKGKPPSYLLTSTRDAIPC